MSKKPPEHPAVVYVEWHDSRALTTRWEDRDKILGEAKTLYNERLVTAGFLLELTKRYVVIAACLAPNDDISEALLIPRSEIRVMKIVKRRRGGKWKKT